MALEDLIARLEREAVTPVTPRESSDVTEKPSNSNAVTSVTPVTPEKTMWEGRFGGAEREAGTPENDNAEVISAAVAFQAPPKRGPNPPAPGSLPARILATGGTSRIGGMAPGGGLYKVAELPADAPAELVADLTAEDRRIMAASARAVPRPDLDAGEWCGEAEQRPATVPAEHGDETEHDAWLTGTPAAELARRTAVLYWRDGDDVHGPGRDATVPAGMAMLDAADWLNVQGLGPVIIIQATAERRASDAT